jgi:hypothetical protein
MYPFAEQHKNRLTSLAICLAMACLVACTPRVKESYMKEFNSFVAEVSENYKTYDDKTWEKQVKKYEKLSGEWYNKFKEEFTLQDEIAIKANQVKWHYYYNLNAAMSTVKELFESLDVKGMTRQVQHYINNNMQDDLKKFCEEAKKAGKEAEACLAGILEELNVKIDEWQK